MALMLKRLGWAALALGAVTLPALRIGAPPVVTESDRQHQRLLDLRMRRQNAAFLWSALTERDSSHALGARAATSAAPPVLFRGFPSDAKSPQVDSIVNVLWKGIGVTDPSVRVAVVIYNAKQFDLAQFLSWNYYGASIRPSEGGFTCVIFMPGARVVSGAIEVNKYLAPDAFGPCALLAAFGAPGSALRPYLEATRYASARSTAWLTRPPDFIDGDGEPPWSRESSWPEMEPEPTPSLLLSSPLVRGVGDLLAPPYVLGVPGLRCLSGMENECRNAVLDTAWVAGRTELAPRDLIFSSGLVDRAQRGGALGSRSTASYWFSDLIRSEGRAKFARFWRSGGTFEAAFHDAFGQDLGAWTMRWGTRQWENSWLEKYRNQPRILGATLAPSWPLVVLGWSALALLGAGWTARRRQVSNA